MEIKRVAENDRIGRFINVEFSEYATDCDVALNFEEFCFVAEDDGKITGVITGRAYYDEVHIGDLIVGKAYRSDGVGSKLVEAVETGYEKASLAVQKANYAVRMYEKAGFKTVNENEEEFKMVCKLRRT